MTTNKKLLIKEFFVSMTCAMSYETNEKSRAFAQRILGLISRIFKEESYKECWDAIENTDYLQKADDIVLMNAIKDSYSEDARMAIGIKSEILSENNIKNLKSFDLDLLSAEVSERAVSGEIHACKLWAYMNWEGLCGSADKRLSIQLWELLAINGDTSSMMALEYAYAELGEKTLSDTWNEVRGLCKPQMKILSPVQSESSSYANEKTHELVELINCIKSKRGKNDGKYIDRCMAHYALYSNDSLVVKLQNILSQNDFYMMLFSERQPSHKNTIGF